MSQFFEHFASSIVTLIAALIAAAITFKFASIQADIARSQRDIALDKLKFDLFQRRYAIYEATKSLLEQMALIGDQTKYNPTNIRALYITLDEARFFFPLDIRKLLNEIHFACERFFNHLAEREQMLIDDSERWRAMADTLAADQAALRAYFATLPQKFEASLAFTQLTGGARPDTNTASPF